MNVVREKIRLASLDKNLLSKHINKFAHDDFDMLYNESIIGIISYTVYDQLVDQYGDQHDDQ